MNTLHTEYYFLGNRDYVHGPTILGSFLTVVERLDRNGGLQPARVITCRFRRLVHENGILACRFKGEGSSSTAGPVWATAMIESGGVEYSVSLLGRESRPIERRIPYDEDAYFADVVVEGDFAGSATLQILCTKKDVIRGIVALNKHLHVETIRRKAESNQYRWIFSSTDNLGLPKFPAEENSVTEEAKARLRLSMLNAWELEGRMYTVSRGELGFHGGVESSFTIGFVGHPR